MTTHYDFKWVNEVAILKPTPAVKFIGCEDGAKNHKRTLQNVAIGVSVALMTGAIAVALGMLVPPLAFPIGMLVGSLGFMAFTELKI